MLDLHHLPGSELEEKTTLVFRRHPLTLLPLILSMLLLFVLPLAVYAIIRAQYPEAMESVIFLPLFALSASTFFLMGWLFTFQLFIDWWLDMFILTDKRILDIEQKGLFGRVVSELRLYRAQDVTAEINGFWHSMFDYGTIFVQTAGEIERFKFEYISHPNLVAKMILEWAELDRKAHLEEAVEEFGVPGKPKTET